MRSYADDGFSDSASEPLPRGMRLAEFEIVGYVGKGGFSIVYLAWDHSLRRSVALKEYMPTGFAARVDGTTVVPVSDHEREIFDIGLKSFVNEGRLLAQFDHPSLAKVYRFWEAHGTAYMVMPLYEGVTLDAAVRAFSQPPDEAWLCEMLEPLTAALLVMHDAQCFHRDIAPDNILMLASSGKPLLLDFGAARHIISDQTNTPTAILKPGYAPAEQYGQDPSLKQGPWTDVYALAAVLYRAITGNTPPIASSRALGDTYVPLARCARGRYSAGFLAAVDRALEVLPDRRTQTIRQFRDELGLGTYKAPQRTALGRRTAAAGLLSLVVVVAGGLLWWFRPANPAGDAPPISKRDDQRDAAVKPQEGPSAPASAPPSVPAPAPPAAPPLTAEAALAQLIAGGDKVVEVEATSSSRQGNTMRVRYKASEPGYLYLLGLRRAKNELLIVYPSPAKAEAKSNAAGDFDAVSPATVGVERYHLIMARAPRVLPDFNWSVRDSVWVRAFGDTAHSASPAWGLASCPADLVDCDSRYAIAGVSVAPPASVPDPPSRPQGECANLLTRASLGDSSPELLEKITRLNCR